MLVGRQAGVFGEDRLGVSVIDFRAQLNACCKAANCQLRLTRD